MTRWSLPFILWRLSWSWRQLIGHHRRIREERAAAARRGMAKRGR